VSCDLAWPTTRLLRMPYRIIFAVADRVPDTALRATALLVFAEVGVAALWRLDAVLARWPLALTARAGPGLVVSLRRHVGAKNLPACA
jgi:hypothetical protein